MTVTTNPPPEGSNAAKNEAAYGNPYQPPQHGGGVVGLEPGSINSQVLSGQRLPVGATSPLSVDPTLHAIQGMNQQTQQPQGTQTPQPPAQPGQVAIPQQDYLASIVAQQLQQQNKITAPAQPPQGTFLGIGTGLNPRTTSSAQFTEQATSPGRNKLREFKLSRAMGSDAFPTYQQRSRTGMKIQQGFLDKGFFQIPRKKRGMLF